MSRFANRAEEGYYNYAPETAETSALSAYDDGTELTTEVRVLNRIFENSENGFGIYGVEAEGRALTMRGVFPAGIRLGAYYTVTGTVIARDTEKQLEVVSYRIAYPSDEEGVLNVLKTLHGLDLDAARLYQTCGANVLDQLRNDPDVLIGKVKSIGYSATDVYEWHQELLAADEPLDTLQSLRDYGIEQKQAKQLLDEFGTGAIFQIQNNPYSLIGRVSGLSFVECDRLALKNGYAPDGLIRVQEAVRYGLHIITDAVGNTCAEKNQFVAACRYYAGYSLSDNEIRALLERYTHDGVRKISIPLGGGHIDIDCIDLRTKMKEWRSSPRKGPLTYPIYRCPDAVLSLAVNNLLTSGAIVRESIDGVSYYRPSAYAAYEEKIASSIAMSDMAAQREFSAEQVHRAILSAIQAKSKLLGSPIELEAQQMLAVQTICAGTGGLFVLTGPAGSGKTFLLGIIIEVLRQLFAQVGLPFAVQSLAPTGKAAKVAEKSTGLPVSTIHRFIGKVTGGDIQRLADFYIIEEFSMVDEALFASAIDQIAASAKVLLLGDTEQLESIGAGNCLRDIIESSAVAHIHLNVVKRQEGSSGVLINANRILQGKMVETARPNPAGAKNNAYYIPQEDPLAVRSKIVSIAARAGLRRFQEETIQVLSPRKQGETGTYTLNAILQQVLNPYRPGPDSMGKSLDRAATAIEVEYSESVGRKVRTRLYFQNQDRVIHTRNNYEKGWYRKDQSGEFLVSGRQGIMNGETGVIERIFQARIGTVSRQRIIVRYGDEYVFYDGDEANELMHAYAITIHKSQGSQWPVVLCPIVAADRSMLSHQLLYTMFTRAQETFYLVGSRGAIEHGIHNTRSKQRRTLLKEQILRACSGIRDYPP